MRRIGLATMVLALAGPVVAQEITALKAARMFDGKSETLVQNAVILVKGTKIEAVGSGLAIPEGAQVIDLGDATLLPGFIDAHTHITGESTDNWLQDVVDGLRQTVAERTVRAVANARKTLEAGFTTIRDVGSGDYVDVGLRNGIRAGVVPGPRILAAVNSLGSRGGHCDETGFPYNRFGYETGIDRGIAAGADQFRDAVRMQVKYGADVIKVCGTGGVLSLGDEVDTPQVTQAEMDAIVDEAHRLRKKVAVHAHGAEGAKVAIRAGADSIEHGSFLDEEALRMMKERGTALVPTFMAVHTVSRKAEAGSFPPEIAEKAKAAAAKHRSTMVKAQEIGVKIVFGTDSAVSPHGWNAQEFALMVEAGMKPAAALKAGTSDAAELLGLTATLGSLQPGLQADIVAVPGDPLADIRQTEKVRFVMKSGKIFKNEPATAP